MRKVYIIILCSIGVLYIVQRAYAQKDTKKSKSVWSQWSKYGPCSATCGPGEMTKQRSCKSKKCEDGESKKTKRCLIKKCGVWAPWSKFSECSKTCEGGIKIRRRKCKGTRCVGQETQERTCRFVKCKEEWRPWGKFGPCSKTCGGGVKIRARKCRTEKCKGPSTDKEQCNKKLCPAPSVWSEWGKFAPCTKSCGTGMKKRTRKCLTKTCRGPDTQTGNCREHPCPGDWSDCTKSCGTGTRFKFDSEACTNPGNPKCLKTFEECNKKPCRKENCDSSTGMQQRYGIKYSCCYAEDGMKRIIDGDEADIEQWPWMVLIQFPRTICGGSIIHQRWILTAGHCLGSLGVSGRTAIKVYTGIQKYSSMDTTKPHSVAEIYRHPKYKDNLENDIALLKLTEDIDLFSGNASTISIPLGEETPLDSTCFATGWGITDPDDSSPSEPLMQVGVQILNPSICRKAYRENRQVGSFVMKTDKLICAGSLSGKNDACMGDSGGPLVCQRCSSCEWYLAGVTSFGPEGDCGKAGHPGMYTRVKSYESWLYSHIPTLKQPSKKCSYRYGP